MPSQPNLLPNPSLSSRPRATPSAAAVAAAQAATKTAAPQLDAERPAQVRAGGRPAPVWLQRLSLLVLVIFCLYLGALVAILPWWPRVWNQNSLLLAYPRLAEVLNSGIARGVISGIGLLDIWIGLSEAIHYRDYRG